MVVQNVPRLPRKSSLADLYGGTESTTPATQIEPEVPKVPRSSAASVLLRRQASPDISDGTKSTTPATQIAESATPATQKSAAPHQSYFVPKLPLTSMVVQKAQRLPRKSSLRCRKCHACHAKDRGATSVLLRRQASADLYGGTESTTPATQIEPEVPKVPRPCHAKDRGATSVLLRRQASADLYGGTESTTPATQIEPEAPKAPRLPRKRPRRHISPTSSPSFR